MVHDMGCFMESASSPTKIDRRKLKIRHPSVFVENRVSGVLYIEYLVVHFSHARGKLSAFFPVNNVPQYVCGTC